MSKLTLAKVAQGEFRAFTRQPTWALYHLQSTYADILDFGLMRDEEIADMYRLWLAYTNAELARRIAQS
jgi:hypothetical protein